MRALGVRNLPVADARTGAVLGMLTSKDVGDYLFEREPCSASLGGKEAFLRAAKGRHGLPAGAAVASPDAAAKAIAALSATAGGVGVVQGASPHHLEVGHHALPNPLKRADGSVGHARRDLGGRELATDAALSEDAFFVNEGDATYAGVFDGVGSWRKLGVDPRESGGRSANRRGRRPRRGRVSDESRRRPRPRRGQSAETSVAQVPARFGGRVRARVIGARSAAARRGAEPRLAPRHRERRGGELHRSRGDAPPAVEQAHVRAARNAFGGRVAATPSRRGSSAEDASRRRRGLRDVDRVRRGPVR